MGNKHNDLINIVLLYLSTVKLCRAWRNETGMAFTQRGTPVKYGLKGSADILGCWNSKFISIEIKTVNDKQRDQQKLFQTAIGKCGGIYILAYELDDVKKYIHD